jgi:hypothetical protein
MTLDDSIEQNIMGSCGSSLNCSKCYSNEPIDGCDTEFEVNQDIAGMGVSPSPAA